MATVFDLPRSAFSWNRFAAFLAILLPIFITCARANHIVNTVGGSEIDDYPYAVDWDDGMCAVGVKQSPIDIVTAAVTSENDVFKKLQTDWRPDSHGELKVTNHNVEYELSEDAAARSPFISNTGETFYLKQFHVHHPSEHSVDGVLYPMEAHFVHLNEAKTKAAAVVSA
eukprot:jgi/Mesvir1/1690/Mv21151-RA.1